ncbi:MAG TPA: hypothetical protein VKE42_03845, partial [Candidatus Cybelea sp.]|nr:hypothetical protein [Candidatus Cybelea sp.]
PEGCAEQFYAHYGKPVAEMTMKSAGRLVFIPKADRSRVDVALGKSVKLALSPLGDADVVDWRRSKQIVVDGVSGYETLDEEKWRWALGPTSTIQFALAKAESVEIRVRARNPLADQAVTLELDGKPVARVDHLTLHEVSERTLKVEAGAGVHRLTLRYANYNGFAGKTFAPGDPRPMALQLYALALHAVP